MTTYAAGLAFSVDYYPTLGGESYDPFSAGGDVTDLNIYSDLARTVLVQSVSGSTRIASGQYRFNVAPIATEGTYFLTVVYDATATGPTITDTNDTFVIVDFGGGVTPTDAYATAADLQLGDLEISENVDKIAYLVRASRDVDLALSRTYVTPITTATGAGEVLLRNVTADLASAYLILAVAQGGEDNQINAYGRHLYDRAWNRLAPYLEGSRIPGAILVETPTEVGPVSITNEDSRSLVQAFYNFTSGPFSPLPVFPPIVRPYDGNV